MIDGIRFKVCGLTSLVDAENADKCGADYLAINLHPASPRYVPVAQAASMLPRMPERRKVAVFVEPSGDRLREAVQLGFDAFQIHFRHDLPLETVAQWSEIVGAENLWIAPKLPSGVDPDPKHLLLADTVLLDTYHKDGFGGTGIVGDWDKFRRLEATHRDLTWILAGGLSPSNIGDALRSSGSRFVDVNSGIESAPGVKDLSKLKAFVVALHKAAEGLRASGSR